MPYICMYVCMYVCICACVVYMWLTGVSSSATIEKFGKHKFEIEGSNWPVRHQN